MRRESDEILARHLGDMGMCPPDADDNFEQECPEQFIDHSVPEAFVTDCKACWLDWARKKEKESEAK